MHPTALAAGPAPHSISISITIDNMSVFSLPWVEAGTHLSGVEIAQRGVGVVQRLVPLRSDCSSSLLQLDVGGLLLFVAVDGVAQLLPRLAPGTGLLLQRVKWTGLQRLSQRLRLACDRCPDH